MLPQVASAFDTGAATVRVRGVTAEGFELRLQEHEARERTGRHHGEETVHYIALSVGSGAIGGRPIVVGASKVPSASDGSPSAPADPHGPGVPRHDVGVGHPGRGRCYGSGMMRVRSATSTGSA